MAPWKNEKTQRMDKMKRNRIKKRIVAAPKRREKWSTMNQTTIRRIHYVKKKGNI